MTTIAPPQFTCPECEKAYATEQQLRDHLSGHDRRAKKAAVLISSATPVVEPVLKPTAEKIG